MSAPRSLEADATALHEALSELVRVYQFRDRDRICCHDVSVTQCYAVEALVRRGPGSLNELAAELYLDKSTASRVVAALERKRYVTRAAHPEDGRAVVLAVTPAGRRLHDRIRASLVDEAGGLLADFEPEVRKGAASLILRLARAAAARSGVSAPDRSTRSGNPVSKAGRKRGAGRKSHADERRRGRRLGGRHGQPRGLDPVARSGS